MKSINVKLLGTPIVTIDGKKLAFPYKKAEALFYYLLIKGHASRDKLVHLLWSEVDEAVAKKNLRNAIYIIKKLFHEDVLISPQRSIITINPALDYFVDVNTLLNSNSESAVEVYQGEFLEGFYVKDAEVFEEWMFSQKEKYKDIYINKLHKGIKDGLKNKDYKLGEKLAKSLIQIDEFDETAYRDLMKSYGFMGRYNQALEVYQKLVDVLNRELSICPDAKTTLLYEKLLKEKNKLDHLEKKDPQDFFYGRKSELFKIHENYKRFIDNTEYKSFIIIGEAGIGKSKLIETALKTVEHNDIEVFTTYCYQAEEKYLLKPWNGIFSKISNFIKENNIEIPEILSTIISYIFPSFAASLKVTISNSVEHIDILKYQVAERAICDVLERVADGRKLILVFEDIQWIDELSLSLLKNLLYNQKNKFVLLIASCRDGYEEKLSQFFAEMGRSNLIEKLYLTRFNQREVIEFALELLPDHDFSQAIKDLMYVETEGNPFFLIEFLNNLQEDKHSIKITSKMEDILRSRFINISEEGKKLLNIASVFFDKVPYDTLHQLCGKTEHELMDLIEELQQKKILKESISSKGNPYFVFTHQKLREFIYEQMSLSRKKILHDKIARHLENRLKKDKRDFSLYSKLIYHFSRANNKIYTLKYSIKNVDTYLQLHNEVFPVLKDGCFQGDKKLFLTSHQALTWLTEIKENLKNIKADMEETEELTKIEANFYHMLGRFYICNGDYERGLDLIHYVITKGLELKDYSLVIHGYRQLIYYCINTQNTNLMAEYINSAMMIATSTNQKEEVGILLRLEGLMKIMEGSYLEGEIILKRSIDTFEELKERNDYILNIAAAYNYIGDSKRYNKEYDEAIDYYKKAIELCESQNILRGLTIFYRNAGLAAFDMGDLEDSASYLNKALGFYNQLDVLWGKSTVHGYLALLLLIQESYEESIKHLLEADNCAQKIKSPYEIGLVFRIKAEICSIIREKKSLRTLFQSILHEGLEAYCDAGIEALKPLNSYEIEFLYKLKSTLQN
ncbi:AAA family ATPase [Alkaliphilus serpentinus]|uniref:AAA family ATPase n=1 Tax=Alkaliphilus serpentinus TaxID=1482731 RepID=A0A833HNG3_9FIRM|nr:AAA family ATPase [Alkaliphilus serpentinus]KAB3529314.1 AAA family ATPase [Alkaliphilus serpentinus]